MTSRREDLVTEASLAHGMGRDVVAADWPALTEQEVTAVLEAWGLEAEGARTLWRSPRPFSAASVIETAGVDRVFVKRHHRLVRTAETLAPEHALATHLRRRGQPVPPVLAMPNGATALDCGAWTYEVHAAVAGDDRYRDARSWTPYRNWADAHAAGAALARFHRAAEGFAFPGRPDGVLIAGVTIAAAADPLRALSERVASRPVLAGWLGGRDWAAEVAPLLTGWTPTEQASTWGHGDWHPSNLTWGRHGVSGVFDLGLANRTGAAFDVAVSIERSIIGWLDLAEGAPPAVDHAALRALLAGYQEEAPIDRQAVANALPLAHVDLALSELEYFAGVVGDEANASLAWDSYLCGHLRWWAGPDGRRLLAEVAKAAGLTAGRRG